jgi:glycosyltransferase involved in cell wall biosynthesis
MRATNTTQPTVVHIINNLLGGGAEASLFALTTHDSKSKHHVISLMGEGKYGPLLTAAGVSVTALDMPRGRVDFGGLVKLFRLIKRLNPEAVQTWMYHSDLIGGIVARLAGTRNIAWGIHHSVLRQGENSRSTILIAKINALLSRFIPRTIVCCAEKACEVHSELGYQRSKMITIPNGYDLTVFYPDEAKRKATRQALQIEDNVALLGFVARFDPLKDHSTLIRALNLVCRQMPNFHVVLVGADIDAENQTLVAALDSAALSQRVTLLGPRDDIPAIMNALDLHVMSSSSEAFPNVLAEAMACATPCVSTDVGDASVIIGETGWVVPPGNPEKLAAAILQALIELGSKKWKVRQRSAVQHIQKNFRIENAVTRYRTEAWRLGANSDV